jgi:hypothetical protein
MLRIASCLLAAALALSACTAEPQWAPEADVTRFRYGDGGTSSVTLYTAIRNRGNEGGHTALLIDGAERVIWDPAGTWWHPQSPERNDLHYGITPWMEAFYIDYHARETYRVVEQRIEVSQATADAMIAAFASYGAVNKANCANATSQVLREFPEFASIRRTWFPKGIMDDFEALPGVVTKTYFDDDDDDNSGKLRVEG